MNLLIDKREQELSVEDHDGNDALIDSLNDNVEERGGFSKSSPTKKSFLGPILIAVFVFAAASVIVYFGFVKKSIRLPLSSTPESVEEISETPATDSTEETKDAAMSPPSAAAARQNSCIKVAPEIMTSILGLLRPEVRISALFFDEGSFSAELITASTEDATSVYKTLESRISTGIALTSSEPKVGQSALIAGTFDSNPTSGVTKISSIDLEEQLRDLADEASALLSSIAISSTAQGQNVFLKLDGSFEACSQYLQRLAQLNWNITVSKLLLMPGQNNSYAFVLRFYL